MFTSRILTCLLAAVAVAGAACGAADGSADAAEPVETTAVAVVDNAFEPTAAEVDAGDTVTWTWEGDNPHDVTFEEVSSEVQRQGTYTRTFDQPGEYAYRCTIHPGMRGTIVVAGS